MIHDFYFRHRENLIFAAHPMNLSQLNGIYLADEKLQSIAQGISSQKSIYKMRGLAGSAGAFIAASLLKQASCSQLFILNDKEEAAYFLNDLENLLTVKREDGEEVTELPVLFFPASYKKPYQVEETDNANVLLRAEVLDRIRREKKVAVVTYPAALTEKVVNRQHLAKNTLELRRGEKVSIAFVTDLLFEYGFERSDYVYEAGQYAVRGGIVDVFSFANEYPYRIEFFGDEVDSIRTFDALTQLSLKPLDRLSILPNVQGKLLSESRESFAEYFGAVRPGNGPNTIWIKDLETLLGLMEREYEAAEKIYSGEISESPLNHLPPSEICVNDEFFRKQLEDFSIIEFGERPLFNGEEILFHFSPQPSFQKNFNLLTQHLAENTSKGFHNFLFADQPKQVERLYRIFDDIGRKFDITPLSLSLHEGFSDNDRKLACFTDHQVFERYHRFRLRDGFERKKEAMTLKELRGLNPGDFVTHIDHGVGRFAGLEKIDVNGKQQEAIRLVYRDNDVLFVSITALHRISKYVGKEGTAPKIDKLGSQSWQNLKQKTKRKVKEIAYDLIQLYAKRKAQKGFAFSPDNYLQNELEASFIYEDTPDQVKSTADVKRDMEAEAPMDRLVCGDVGFGKTEIAIRAAFKAVCDSKQVAVLVPTTILALQHYKTFSDRLAQLPAKVEYLNRFRTAKEKKDILARLEKGQIDIIIGTHMLVSKDVKFKDLGLMVIDEEQKFGVAVKDKLKLLRANVDSLTLTATPIPRTLQFSMMGARDLSVINTPPPNRYPVQTELHTFSEEVFRDAVTFELQRGGQVFVVHNRIQSLPEVAGMISRLCPNARVTMGHGQMPAEKFEEVMLGFIDGQYDVLVSTTIIESGLDIGNANTIIINDAHNFGLSDLHQMRGRVGRSNRKAFCYLITPPSYLLTSEAQKRLRAISEFSDLGSGFQIAMRDLDIRGAGNLLGAEQSGFISEIGYDMYQKILDEAIMELKENEFRDLFREEEQAAKSRVHDSSTKHVGIYVKDTQIDTDLGILIPDEYVENITERLSLYRRLDDSETDNDLDAFETQLRDRFGPVPAQVTELIDAVRLRWIGMQIGIERIVLKNGKMIAYFIPNQQSAYYQSEAFTRVLRCIQSNPRMAKMKEANNKLTLSFESVTSIGAAIVSLKPFAEFPLE